MDENFIKEQNKIYDQIKNQILNQDDMSLYIYADICLTSSGEISQEDSQELERILIINEQFIQDQELSRQLSDHFQSSDIDYWEAEESNSYN